VPSHRGCRSRPNADQANGSDITFEQGIRGLGCAVREKRNIVWVCPDIVEQSLEGLDDAVRDAFDMLMTRRYFRLPDELHCLGVDRDGIGECATDVDADPNTSIAHVLNSSKSCCQWGSQYPRISGQWRWMPE
jgi:hypothetical protein